MERGVKLGWVPLWTVEDVSGQVGDGFGKGAPFTWAGFPAKCETEGH